MLGLEDTAWPVAVKIPGGRWRCRLRDAYVHDVARHCFSSTGEEQWHEIHGPMNKSMQEASATRAGNAYVARRLGERQVEGASRTEVWDHRPHEGRGGKGSITQAVWKLKRWSGIMLARAQSVAGISTNRSGGRRSGWGSSTKWKQTGWRTPV